MFMCDISQPKIVEALKYKNCELNGIIIAVKNAEIHASCHEYIRTAVSHEMIVDYWYL